MILRVISKVVFGKVSFPGKPKCNRLYPKPVLPPDESLIGVKGVKLLKISHLEQEKVL